MTLFDNIKQSHSVRSEESLSYVGILEYFLNEAR